MKPNNSIKQPRIPAPIPDPVKARTFKPLTVQPLPPWVESKMAEFRAIPSLYK